MLRISLIAALIISLCSAEALAEDYITLIGNIPLAIPPDSSEKDTTKLKYPIKDTKRYPTDTSHRSGNNGGGVQLTTPPNMEKEVRYNPVTRRYETYYKVGDVYYKSPKTQSFEEYFEERKKEQEKSYFQERAEAQNYTESSGLIPKVHVPGQVFEKVFGGGIIDIRPSISAELSFGGNFNTVRNPSFTVRQQRTSQFDFQQKIQMNINGSIGERLKINMNYDTEATFDFENQVKLDWVGKEDDIIKKIELGNVSLPLNGTLIQGGQSLFGIKTQMQFGRLLWTAVVTSQKGETSETEVRGGAQVTDFNIQAHNYDVNRHYFLAHFFRDNYDRALSNLPVIQSGAIITRIEVWVTNRSQTFNNTRDVLALTDLADTLISNPNIILPPSSPITPDNSTNSLYSTLADNPNVRKSNQTYNTLKSDYPYLREGVDYELVNNMRLLSPNEFTFHQQLGYVSLNFALNNDEVLAVAYEYTFNGIPFKVGEFSRDVPNEQGQSNVLLLKTLKSNIIRTDNPVWDLMMKNIYSLGTFNIKPEDFQLNVIYADDPSGADLNYLPVENVPNVTNKQLISVLNLDRINKQSEPAPDGVFDIIEGITMNTTTGRIIFPVVEPFGTFLSKQLTTSNAQQTNQLKNYYVYQQLYDSTKWIAQQDVSHNKFFLRGSYKGSSSNEISLNAINVPEGSVKVTANGTQLTENVDYIVDYTIGKVTILNSGILSSGAVIKVTSESNSLFNIQQKTLLGSRFDYKVNNDFLLGATVMHLYERPLTPKVNIGDEPLLNTMLGLDGSYTRKSLWLTKLVDKIPFIETKEPSTITLSGEYAVIIPGEPRTIGQRGTSYIDDFEAAETPFELKRVRDWHIASIPLGQPGLFPETTTGDVVDYGSRRAQLAWYTLDPTFFRNDRTTPDHIKEDVEQQSDHFLREVRIDEVFPNKQIQQGSPQNLPTLDLAYYPKEKGPYNFNVDNLKADGTLDNPEQNWAGIMRRMETNDFEAANIDYLEIWVMDPYYKERERGNLTSTNNGQLYINFGSVSEDVLPDGVKSFENGLPKDGGDKNIDTTRFGKVSTSPTINNAFDNEPASRPNQDVGLDGLKNEEEQVFWKTYLDAIQTKYGTNSVAYQNAANDPANDDYRYFRGSDLDDVKASILERYKKYNGFEGNSTLDKLPDGTPKSATNTPDDEDINRDYSLNRTENYFQYKINVSMQELVVGKNYVTDSSVVSVKLKNGKSSPITWYQLKIPIREYDKRVGSVSDFKSIRFMRMFLKGFQDSTIFRFGQMQLVRADWRRYLEDLNEPGSVVVNDPNNPTEFVVSTVNIEENGRRTPIPYVVPPSIFREIDVTSPGVVQQNEQSLSLRVANLQDGDARGAFKTTDFDIRNYKTLKMFVHAESRDPLTTSGKMTAFIRLGTDLTNNYYEYEIPLTLTPDGSSIDDQIWPANNEIDIDIEEFLIAKQNRPPGSLAPIPVSKGFVRVVGLPDLSNVKVIMLGVRNPEDDGLPTNGEVWFNELRLANFTNKGGWAANARMVTQLADFATVNLSGSIQTIGFGGIDKKLNERNLHETYQYDANTSVELGKFFNQKLGITIPMFVGFSELFVRPKFNPLNPDIELKTALATLEGEDRERVKNASEDYTSRYSINFINVRKNRVGNSKAHIYDIENFNVSYSFQRTFHRNQTIEYNTVEVYEAGLGYNYGFKPKYLQPFKKVKGKYLQLIRDINFSYLPQNINVTFNTKRYYSELLNRNNDNFKALIVPFYDKNFTMTRNYNMQYNPTRSIKVTYAAVANARIDEPIGKIDTDEKRDSIRENFFKLGRMTSFDQRINASYAVPLNKIPILNWITTTASYGANFNWNTAPPAAITLGNTIQNSRTQSYNTNFNMIGLYNKIPYFREAAKTKEQKEREKERERLKEKRKKEQEKKTEGDETEEEEEEDTKSSKETTFTFGENLAKTVMMVKNVSFTKSYTEGIALPGFTPKVSYLGQNWDLNTPGANFILGSQDPNIRYQYAEDGFLTNDPNQNNFFINTSSVTTNARATVEPFKDFRIDINFTRTESKSTQSVFRYNEDLQEYFDDGLTETGTYTTSFNTWSSAFEKVGDDNTSATFEQFKNNRFVIARRLQLEDQERSPGDTTDDKTGFPLGYGPANQSVLISSFIAAYTGKNAANVSLSPFPSTPKPNWRINYTGLSRIEAIKNFASNITLSHGYTNTYTVANYRTSTAFAYDSFAQQGQNLEQKYAINTVSITERFAPLIGVDVTFNSGLTTRMEYKKDRNLTLLVNSFQLTESRNQEYVFGFGYKKKGFRIPFKINGGYVTLENDLNIRVDVSIRDGVTIIRKLDGDINEPTSGNKIISIKPTIDYMINERLNFQFFYDRRATKPAVSNSFPTAITQTGFRLRYTYQ